MDVLFARDPDHAAVRPGQLQLVAEPAHVRLGPPSTEKLPWLIAQRPNASQSAKPVASPTPLPRSIAAMNVVRRL